MFEVVCSVSLRGSDSETPPEIENIRGRVASHRTVQCVRSPRSFASHSTAQGVHCPRSFTPL